MAELGADPDQVYFDVPRLRLSTANDYLTSGISYAFHPHRDTWYSAPQAAYQLVVSGLRVPAGKQFGHLPAMFPRSLPNSSETYNYYRWNLESRGRASRQVGKDTRVQPKLTAE